MIRFNKPSIGRKDLESVLYCMIKDDLTPGAHMKSFASLLAQEIGLSSVAVFHSFYHACECVFGLIGAAAGDEVVLPSFCRPDLLRVVSRMGLIPRLVDLEEDSFQPSPAQVERAITARTRCVVLSQMFGVPYDLNPYQGFGIPLIEDTDGSIGSTVGGKKAGTFGSFSLMHFDDEAMITTGNGGMIASKDKDNGRLIQKFRNDSDNIGFLMSDFNASLGISQLNKLGKSVETRRKIGRYFDDAVLASGCSLVGRDDAKELVYSSYVVKTGTPFEECHRFFKKNGIPLRKGLEKPLHSRLDLDVKDFPATEEMCNRLVAFPIYPGLDREDIEAIAKGIRAIL